MALDLPRPIELYFAADNSSDPNDLDACFAADAIVLDEAHTHRGLAAIKHWKAEAKKKYGHVVEPLQAEQRGGATVVSGKLSGNFPGSPVTLEYSFTLLGDKIAALEIRG